MVKTPHVKPGSLLMRTLHNSLSRSFNPKPYTYMPCVAISLKGTRAVLRMDGVYFVVNVYVYVVLWSLKACMLDICI